MIYDEYVEPDLSLWGPLTTEIHTTVSDELLTEVLDFFDTTLIPELVCSPTFPDRPHSNWIIAEGRKVLTCKTDDGTLIGCWILKDSQIMYPCIDVTHGANGMMPVIRALAYKSFESEGDKMWASTENRLILTVVQRAADSPPEKGRPADMPLPKINGDRIEWKL